jgi:hypothetical protein
MACDRHGHDMACERHGRDIVMKVIEDTLLDFQRHSDDDDDDDNNNNNNNNTGPYNVFDFFDNSSHQQNYSFRLCIFFVAERAGYFSKTTVILIDND